jgi:hypothetical protein
VVCGFNLETILPVILTIMEFKLTVVNKYNYVQSHPLHMTFKSDAVLSFCLQKSPVIQSSDEITLINEIENILLHWSVISLLLSALQ